MKSASLQELRLQLKNAAPAELMEYCIRLARHKVENKELLTYLIYEQDNETAFIRGVCDEADTLFAGINRSHVYYAKKGLRKILRFLQKNIRFAASKQVEIELLLHFCERLLDTGLPVQTHRALKTLLDTQIAKLEKAIGTLHEDLQYDYRKALNRVKENTGSYDSHP